MKYLELTKINFEKNTYNAHQQIQKKTKQTMINLLSYLALFATLLNGFITTFEILHIGVIICLLTFLINGFVTTLQTFTIFGILMLVLNYEFVVKTYNVSSRTLNNVIKLAEIENENKEEIQTMKSIQKKVIWFESKYDIINLNYKYIKKQTTKQFDNFIEKYNESILKSDIEFFLKILNFFSNLATSIIFEMYQLLKEMVIIGYYIKACESYLIVGTNLYEQQNTQVVTNKEKIKVSEAQSDSIINQMDQVNDLIDMMMPTLESLKNMPLKNISLKNMPLQQPQNTFDLNNLGPMPSDKDMMNMLQMFGNFSSTNQKVKPKKNK